ncbi:MAG: sigma-70 family RNA polymerase sigma factor [Chloroflexi bacterium]|nr:MAG: sigma-70 family RNA polymerase sigma factor [Chloroflexota bacterium]
MQEDLDLLRRARALEQDALAQIHDTYYAAIYRYIALRINDRETAEDLTSEVFIRLLNALQDKTAPERTLRGWLFSVASRVVKDYYRKLYRSKETELSDTIPGHELGPDKELEKKSMQTALRNAITELTEEQQNVLALRYGFEMPIREVARLIGKSEGAVKMLQARAIAALSKKLGRGE